MQWLRDGLKIIAKAADAGELAASSDPAQSIYCVPAFAGLGAPHWSSEARALLCGITRGTTRNDIARAALESVGYQTRDLVEAMRSDAGGAIDVIRVDGGMAASDWTMQFLADILGVPVDRPRGLESTAQGAAFAAGWQAGLYPGPEFVRRQAPQGSPLYPADGREYARAALPRLARRGGKGAIAPLIADPC